jgi:hypothetical protein
MAGKYVTLVAATDYMEGRASLVAARATSAEDDADRFIDSQFAAWDRTEWGLACPPEVAGIAKKYASGEYLRREFATASPDAQPAYVADLVATGRGVATPSFAADLFAEAKAEADMIRARGYLVAADGIARLYADADQKPMFARVSR